MDDKKFLFYGDCLVVLRRFGTHGRVPPARGAAGFAASCRPRVLGGAGGPTRRGPGLGVVHRGRVAEAGGVGGVATQACRWALRWTPRGPRRG